jgi:hypothetical protein
VDVRHVDDGRGHWGVLTPLRARASRYRESHFTKSCAIRDTMRRTRTYVATTATIP